MSMLWVRSITVSERTSGALEIDESLVHDRSCFECNPDECIAGTQPRGIMVRFIISTATEIEGRIDCNLF